MDWTNVDFNSPYEIGQDFLTGYNFDILLMECEHNLREITKEAILKYVRHEIELKAAEANDIINSNIDSILKEALKYRNKK